jgi:FKBP-type peptidyl-prolyl cis-trans isomerase 2
VLEVDRAMLPDDLDPELGQQLEVQQSDGATAVVTVTEIGDATITLDANHPLAGKDLIFDIALVAVEEVQGPL